MTPHETAAALSEAQKLVIMAMGCEQECCRSFKHIAAHMAEPMDDLPAVVRSLRDLGIAAFHTGLITDDGGMYGSGYGLTRFGLDVQRAILEQRHD